MGTTPTRYPVDDSPDPVAVWCARVEREYGAAVAPIVAHSPAPELLSTAWRLLRATMVAPGLVDRTTKEAVAAAVAQANSCWYCEELHVTVLESCNRRRPTDSEITSLADRRMRQITAWAREPGAARPFDDRHVPELVGTVVVAHYLNRIALVLGDSRTADESRFAAVARRARGAAVNADPLPGGRLPAELGWASGRPDVASAFARAAVAIDAAGADAVPEWVRAVVLTRLAEWHGEPLGREDERWTELARHLTRDERLAGRLALLTAIAPTQVDPMLVATWRDRAGARALVELVSWASFTAARRIGAWQSPVRPAVAPESPQVLPFRRSGPTRGRPAGRRRSGGQSR